MRNIRLPVQGMMSEEYSEMRDQNHLGLFRDCCYILVKHLARLTWLRMWAETNRNVRRHCNCRNHLLVTPVLYLPRR